MREFVRLGLNGIAMLGGILITVFGVTFAASTGAIIATRLFAGMP